MFKALLFPILFAVALADGHDDGYDYYDINTVYNQFYVSCGTPEEPYMRITFGGDAYSVYAAKAPSACKAQEVAPAVFLIDIHDYTTTDCPVHEVNTGDHPIRMLDVVVQRGTVRKWTDDYKQITCNYGIGGHAQNNETDAEEGAVDKQPVWQSAIHNETTTDSVSLHVYDTSNQEITSAVLGNYIQLRAFLSNTTSTEHSIKVFNCRAYSGSLEYYMVVGGCGEGDVMPVDRGFRTQVEAIDGNADVSRVSRSSYFKSFLLPDEDYLTFECDYILCAPDQCDGYSCENSIMLTDDVVGRKKRSVSTTPALVPTIPALVPTIPALVPQGNMPSVISSRVKILPQQDQYYRISGSDLLRAGESSQASVSLRAAYPDQRYYVPEKTLVQEAGVPEAEMKIMGLDMLNLGLLTGVCLLALLLITTLASTLLVCKKANSAIAAQGYYQNRMNSSVNSMAPLYTSPNIPIKHNAF